MSIFALPKLSVWFCAVLLFAYASFSASASRLTDTQKAKVKISLKQNTAYEFVVTVDFMKQRYRFATLVPDFESATEGLLRQRALMGWKGDYLFVRHQCGQPAEWRCVVDQVFTLDGSRLAHLGAVESASCKELGCRYRPDTGLFVDLYDVYQINPVTGNADTPPLPIARRADRASLVADLDETWRMNEAAYRASLACLEQIANAGFEPACRNNESPWSAVTFIAKLTHYTARTKERDSLFANQANGYCAKSADPKCKWRVAGVQDYFQRFQPGASPIYNPSPVTMASASADESKALESQKTQPGKAIKLKP